MRAWLDGSRKANSKHYRSPGLESAPSFALASSADITIDNASETTNEPINVQIIRVSARKVVANQVLGKFIRMNMQAIKNAIQASESPAPTQLTL